MTKPIVKDHVAVKYYRKPTYMAEKLKKLKNREVKRGRLDGIADVMPGKDLE